MWQNGHTQTGRITWNTWQPHWSALSRFFSDRRPGDSNQHFGLSFNSAPYRQRAGWRDVAGVQTARGDTGVSKTHPKVHLLYLRLVNDDGSQLKFTAGKKDFIKSTCLRLRRCCLPAGWRLKYRVPWVDPVAYCFPRTNEPAPCICRGKLLFMKGKEFYWYDECVEWYTWCFPHCWLDTNQMTHIPHNGGNWTGLWSPRVFSFFFFA